MSIIMAHIFGILLLFTAVFTRQSQGTTCCSMSCGRLSRDTTLLKQHNGQCYQFVHKETYWTSARDFCQARGGRLLTIPDEQTNHFIVLTLNGLPWRNNGVWVGLHDRNGEGDWEWVTEDGGVGQTPRYSNWARGHPKGFMNRLRDCVRMVRGSGNWYWHETLCSALLWKYRFICQYDMGLTTHIMSRPEPHAKTTTVSIGSTGTNNVTELPIPKVEGQVPKSRKYHVDDDTNNQELPIIVSNPQELQQHNAHQPSGYAKAMTGIAVVCGIGFIVAVALLLLLFVRRSRQIRLQRKHNVINPVYGREGHNPNLTCLRASGDVSSLKGAENDYVVNVYANPLNHGKAGFAKLRPMKTETRCVSDKDSGYEEPIKTSAKSNTGGYYPMEGSTKNRVSESTSQDGFVKAGVALPEIPGTNKYDCPRACNAIYAEIGDRRSHCGDDKTGAVYESLDDLDKTMIKDDPDV